MVSGEVEASDGDGGGGTMGDGDRRGGRERDKGVEIGDTPLKFVFGVGTRSGKETEGLKDKASASSGRRTTPLSYKEKLLSLGCGGYLVSHEENEDIVNGWKSFFIKQNQSPEASRDDEDANGVETEGTTIKPRYPELKVSAEQYTAWCQPWWNSLIVKLLGVQIPKHVLIDRVRRMWKPKEPMKVTPLSNGYYIVSFTSREDKDYAFQEGPWMIEDHYLIVQRWRPNFNPWKVDVQRKIAAWVRIPDLPMEFYNVESLGIIGNMIGKTIKVDRSTSIYDKGGFARICVEIDLQQPLLPAFMAFGEEWQIVYEGLHQVCFQWGKYGHEKQQCPQFSGEGDSSNGSRSEKEEANNLQIPVTGITTVVADTHLGPQMLVSRDFRRNIVMTERKGYDGSTKGADNKGAGTGNNGAEIKENNIGRSGKNQARIQKIYKLVGEKKDKSEKGSVSSGRKFGDNINTNSWTLVGSKRKVVDKIKVRGKENTLGKAKAKVKEGINLNEQPIEISNPFHTLQTGMKEGEAQYQSIVIERLGPGPSDVENMGNQAQMSRDNTLATVEEPDEVARIVDGDIIMKGGAKTFPSLIQELKNHFCLDFLALVETRSDKQKSERRIGSLGFQGYTFIEAEGFSGGIWCLWNAGVQKVDVIEQHRQFLHLRIINSRREHYFFTVIYASPHMVARRHLWSELHRIERGMHEPWVIGGDFNATLFSSERHTHAPNGLSIDREFCNWYEESSLSDIGFVGPYFTWKRGVPSAYYKSDHCPLLLQMHQHVDRPSRPFQFIAAWVLHDEFSSFVKANWMEDTEWNFNLDQFTRACSSWNKQVFRHTEERKRKLLRRMDGVNRALGQGGNVHFYEEIQVRLWKELEEVLIQESLIWAQKARMDWSLFGNRNTKFFHTRANKRRKMNRIDAIRLEGGDWCYDIEVIKREATRYFATLFAEEVSCRDALHCVVSYPKLDEVDLRFCGRHVEEREIKEALFSMGSLKSPGPDGFNALFYQTQWDSIGRSLVESFSSSNYISQSVWLCA
ncbi:uncharacterized protein LOC114727667 [Neltuma alba]|uniref:uncharacterized protein LOC114727667 n=1 Tax=Neltuma alba TaxID=207710 RepID=UPI0010A2AC3F|nr:uncharacterized protein LOC114727667 [Prosopis alba]